MLTVIFLIMKIYSKKIEKETVKGEKKVHAHQIYYLILYPIPNKSFDGSLHEDFIGWCGGKPYDDWKRH